MKDSRNYSLIDKICIKLDQTLRTLNDNSPTTQAKYPAGDNEEAEFTETERRKVIGLMRINHAGEIAAQGLYHGQALISRNEGLKNQMQQAALEEGDHLAWCKKRLDELGGQTSYLKPLWYSGSFCIGILAGLVGDKWSLGFVAETEQQVVKHLQSHLHQLPSKDERSIAILQQMEKDEAKHKDEAISSGAYALPQFIKKWMSLTSKIMVKTAYWI